MPSRFQRLSDFATTCQERVFDRFPDVPVYGHFKIFESVEVLELRDVAPSFGALGAFYNLAENHLENFISGLRKLWAERCAEVTKGQAGKGGPNSHGEASSLHCSDLK